MVGRPMTGDFRAEVDEDELVDLLGEKENWTKIGQISWMEVGAKMGES
jgi:hypothetical protein